MNAQIQIGETLNGKKEDFRGLPKESVQEYLARGGKVEFYPMPYKELPTRRAFPTYANQGKPWLRNL